MGNKKIQLEAGMNADGVVAGATQAENAVDKMASSIQGDARRADAALKGMGDGAKGAAAKIERETRNMAASIQRNTDLLNAGEKRNAAYFEARAVRSGIPIDAIRADLDKLRSAEDAAAKRVEGSLTNMGMSARQTTAALRQIPAQFTDIFVSLQGGQNPMTVLLQQGGQLKDVFGGAGAAARAMGSYVAGLITPTTVLVAATAGVGYAAYAGSEELGAYQRALILSGNAAGVTAGQLAQMAAAIGQAGSGSTTGRAAELLAGMAAAGALAAGSMQRVAQAALDIERAGGPAAEKTVAAFEALAKKPLEAALKLNETQNFLTQSTYQQIKALSEQGRTTDAARVAQDALASTLEARAPQMLASLGTVERAWLGVKTAISGAVDAVKGIGRTDGALLEQIKQLEDLIAKNKQSRGFLGADTADKELATLQAKLSLLQKAAGYEELSAQYQAQSKRQLEARSSFEKDDSAFLPRMERLKREIARVTNEGLAAGSANDPDLAGAVAKRIELLKQRADPGVDLQKIKDIEAQRLEILQRSQGEIERQKATGELNERAAIEATTKVTLDGLNIRKQALQAQLSIVSKRQDQEREAESLRGALSLLEQERLTAEKKGRDDVSVAIYKQKQAGDLLIRTQQEEIAQEQAEYFVRESKARETLSLSIYAYGKSVQEAGEQLALESSLIGVSQSKRELAIAKLRVEISLRERLKAIDSVYGTDAAGDVDRANAREAAAKEVAQIESRAYLSEWQKTWGLVADGLSDAILSGGKSAAASIKSLFKSMVLSPAIKAVIQGGSNSAAGFLGGGAGNWNYVGAALDYGRTFSGSAYGTNFGSEQSRMLAAQDAGMGGSSVAGLASTLSTAAPYIAAVVYGSKLALKDQASGFNGNAARLAGDGFGGRYGVGTVFAETSQLFQKLGLNGQWADILSMSTGFSKFFGRAAPQATASGISGSFGGGGFDGQAFQDWFAKGGWFRNDKSGTNFSALSKQNEGLLDSQGKLLSDAVYEWASALRLPVESLKNVSTQVRVQFTGNAEEDQKAIEAALKTYGDALSGTFETAIAPFAKAGEEVAATLERLAGIQRFSEALNDMGGIFGRVATLGFDARQSLFDLAGGIDAFRQQAQGFVSNYYSRDEIAGVKARDVQGVLGSVGIKQDINTRDQFRALVEGTDVSTDQGRKTLATLLGLQADFAAVADYLSASGVSLSQAATQAPDSAILQGLLDKSSQAEQIDAINGVGAIVVTVREAIVDLINAVREGGRITIPGDWEVAQP